MITALVKLLSCPKCGGKFQKTDKAVLCNACQSSFPIKTGKIFFIEVPRDISQRNNFMPVDKKKWSNWRKANYQYFKEHLERLPSSKIVLDLGAGPSQFRDITSRFKDSLAVDFLPYELVNVVADINKKLPFQDSSFDIILLSNVLEHIPDSKFLLEECFRTLRTNGFLVGTIPFLMKIHQKPYDFNRFTNHMLERLLKQTGFRRIEVKNLATSLDVYQTFQRHFFNDFLTTDFSKNKIINYTLKFIAKSIWQIQKLLMIIFSPIYRRCMNSPEYTQGYGFSAFK